MPKSSKDEVPHRESLDEYILAIQKAAALKTALELELFTRVAEGNRSLPALLRITGFNERGTRILLDALANLGLLVKQQFEYTLTPTAEAFLVKSGPSYYGDTLLSLLAWESRGNLAKAVRTGKPAAGNSADGLMHASTDWVEWQSVVEQFAMIWEQLQVSAPDNVGLRCLAFGSEAALEMLSLAQRDRRTQIIVIDPRSAFVPLMAVVDALHVKSQIRMVEGDWLDAALPAEPFHLVAVSSMLSGQSVEQNIGVLHRAFDALIMGGRIVLRAVMADDERRGPNHVPLEGLDILLSSAQGDLYTVTEYRGMLEAAGFFEVQTLAEGILTARRTLPPPPLPPAPTVAPDFIPPPQTLE